MLTIERRLYLESSTSRYQESLEEAALYLAGRGITEETALSFRLGVVADPAPGDEQFKGRLSIPYITPSGIVDIRYRCLEDHKCKDIGHPKYMGRAGAVTHIYNVGAFLDATSFVCVTEGEIDAITLSQCGLPAVGLPGASSWKKHYPKLFEDYEDVYVYTDGDEAGLGFGRKLEAEIGGLVVPMPEAHDCNSAYLVYGADFLTGKIYD
jgi:DNA primase